MRRTLRRGLSEMKMERARSREGGCREREEKRGRPHAVPCQLDLPSDRQTLRYRSRIPLTCHIPTESARRPHDSLYRPPFPLSPLPALPYLPSHSLPSIPPSADMTLRRPCKLEQKLLARRTGRMPSTSTENRRRTRLSGDGEPTKVHSGDLHVTSSQLEVTAGPSEAITALRAVGRRRVECAEQPFLPLFTPS